MTKMIFLIATLALVSCGKSGTKGSSQPKDIDIQFQTPRTRDNLFTVPVRIDSRSFFVRKGGSKTVEQADRRQCSFGIRPGRFYYEIQGKKLLLRSGQLYWELHSATIYDRREITGSWRGDIFVGDERLDVTLRFLNNELTIIFTCR